MNLSLTIRSYLPVFALMALIITTYCVYFPGLKGGFLFDDYPNLEELGTYGGVVNFETFKNFVFNGISSPIGRPLALSSFLLDDNNWPSRAAWFKPTNLKIHLLTGLLLCWSTLHLMRLYGRNENEAAWIALLSSGIWLLHPYMLSTTLYVIQRMAQLAAMFVFAGLVGYLYGRIQLSKNKIKAAYVWMSLSVGLATPLALLCKENGVLLPLLILVVEFCLPVNLPRLAKKWMFVFLWIPTLVILYKLAKTINFSPDAWPARAFTQPERLLTEPRIIWEYLSHLYFPRIEGRGLFQDGYNFSRSFFDPINTSLAIIALGLVFAGAVKYKKQYPLWSLAFLFYLAGHLIESSVVGLELYFEHRNYLTSAFLFLPIASFLVDLKIQRNYVVALIASFLLLAMLSFLTWKRANLWSNTEQLEMYWAASTPESPRAQNKIASFMLGQGRVDESIKYIEEAGKRFPKNSLVTINELLIKVYVDKAVESDFVVTANRIKAQPFDAQAVMGLRNIVDKVTLPGKDDNYKRFTLNFLNDIQSSESYKRFHLFRKLIPYLKARVYLSLMEYDLAYESYSEAIPLYADTDSALNMVAEMANADRPVEAMMLFKQAENVFRSQPDKTLMRSRKLYDSEFKRLRGILLENLKAIGISTVNEVNLDARGDVNHDQHSNSGKK